MSFEYGLLTMSRLHLALGSYKEHALDLDNNKSSHISRSILNTNPAVEYIKLNSIRPN